MEVRVAPILVDPVGRHPALIAVVMGDACILEEAPRAKEVWVHEEGGRYPGAEAAATVLVQRLFCGCYLTLLGVACWLVDHRGVLGLHGVRRFQVGNAAIAGRTAERQRQPEGNRC